MSGSLGPPTALVGFKLSGGLVSAVSVSQRKAHLAEASSPGAHGDGQDSSSACALLRAQAKYLTGLFLEPIADLAPLRSLQCGQLWFLGYQVAKCVHRHI